jgi:dodecin
LHRQDGYQGGEDRRREPYAPFRTPLDAGLVLLRGDRVERRAPRPDNGLIANGEARKSETGRSEMADHTYRVTEIVGSSSESIEDAVRGAIARAAQTVRGLDWFEVTEIRGHLTDGEIGHFQVGMKVGFRLEAPE